MSKSQARALPLERFQEHGVLPRPASSAAGLVAGARVAVQAVELLPRRRDRHRVDDGGMAAQAVGPHDLPVPGRDLDGLLENLQREGRRVAEPMIGLDHPLRQAAENPLA